MYKSLLFSKYRKVILLAALESAVFQVQKSYFIGCFRVCCFRSTEKVILLAAHQENMPVK